MVDRIDPAGRLREIGRTDTPPLDGDRLARIEARVLATVAEPLVPQPSVAGVDGRRRIAPMIAIAAALLVLAVLGAVALAARGRDDGLVIEAAEGVVIDVPGGEPTAGSSGDRLPDGTVVEIGPAGSATIDGVAYGPGRYLVGGGTLRPDRPEASPAGDSDETPVPAATYDHDDRATRGGAPGLGDDHLHDVESPCRPVSPSARPSHRERPARPPLRPLPPPARSGRPPRRKRRRRRPAHRAPNRPPPSPRRRDPPRPRHRCRPPAHPDREVLGRIKRQARPRSPKPNSPGSPTERDGMGQTNSVTARP